jgi:hypothetical protein
VTVLTEYKRWCIEIEETHCCFRVNHIQQQNPYYVVRSQQPMLKSRHSSRRNWTVLVLSIKASKSFSITWLNAFEAPTIQYPRSLALSTQTTEKDTLLKKNPAIEDKTLRANPAFVISLKSRNSFIGKCIWRTIQCGFH